jgi:sialic acid synthase SpsE
MVAAVRTMEQALGSPDKRFLASERSCYSKLGKSVVAAKDLSEGTILQPGDLAIKVNTFLSALHT